MENIVTLLIDFKISKKNLSSEKFIFKFLVEMFHLTQSCGECWEYFPAWSSDHHNAGEDPDLLALSRDWDECGHWEAWRLKLPTTTHSAAQHLSCHLTLITDWHKTQHSLEHQSIVKCRESVLITLKGVPFRGKFCCSERKIEFPLLIFYPRSWSDVSLNKENCQGLSDLARGERSGSSPMEQVSAQSRE